MFFSTAQHFCFLISYIGGMRQQPLKPVSIHHGDPKGNAPGTPYTLPEGSPPNQTSASSSQEVTPISSDCGSPHQLAGVSPLLIYLGIDPGVTGGMVAILGDSGVVIATPMPADEVGIWDWIHTLVSMPGVEVYAVIEQVQGWVGKKRTTRADGTEFASDGAPGSAMFKFGTVYGLLRMALIGNGIEFEAVAPQTWQKRIGFPKLHVHESQPEHKRRLRQYAISLFPREKVTLKTADAFLLAEYCRLQHAGEFDV